MDATRTDAGQLADEGLAAQVLRELLAAEIEGHSGVPLDELASRLPASPQNERL